MRKVARRVATLCVATCGIVALTAAAAAASPVVDENYLPFKNCPVKNKSVKLCVIATTTSGEFKMGSKTVTIEHPVVLQGGVANSEGLAEIIPPTSGAIMEAPPMKVPGGLTGIEGLGEEVTATTELVGPVLLNKNAQSAGVGTAVILPLRAKLNNATLGNECFIGGAGEPILLNLTTGTTSPPAPNTPISGSHGTLTITDGIINLNGVSLVDNSFSAPGVNGCGESLSAILDPVVDASAGLPSAAGKNAAVLNGTVQIATAKAVKKAHVIPKVKKSKGT